MTEIDHVLRFIFGILLIVAGILSAKTLLKERFAAVYDIVCKVIPENWHNLVGIICSLCAVYILLRPAPAISAKASKLSDFIIIGDLLPAVFLFLIGMSLAPKVLDKEVKLIQSKTY